MRKLKIIQILPTLNTGGVERGVLDFNRYLVDKGHESYVISNGGRQVKNLIDDGGKHIHLQIAEKSLFTLFQAKKLADVINEISPDVIHIRSRIPAWVLQLSKFFIKNPRPLIFSTFHGLYSTPFYSRIMASFDRVIAISKTVEQYIYDNYERHLKKPPMLIYRGSDESYFTSKFEPKQEYLENFYKNSNYLLQISSYEGMPHTILEAMNHKLVIIASNFGGNYELIGENIHGYLVESIKENDIVSAIKIAVDDIDKESKVIKAKELIEKEYDIKSTIKNYSEVILKNDWK